MKRRPLPTGLPTAADYEEYIQEIQEEKAVLRQMVCDRVEENQVLRETIRHLLDVDRNGDGTPLSELWALTRGGGALKWHDSSSCEVCTRAASYTNPTADVPWWRW